ncbi:MAG: hypothetical protein JW712_13625 [Dehalococcoidales bacterium]|nr:hypothetical protein [Dehalococcoidales bacterium]
MTIILLVVINAVFLMSVAGFIVSPWMLVSNFAAIPLVFLMFVLLIISSD